jgi:serine/threonine protein kinase
MFKQLKFLIGLLSVCVVPFSKAVVPCLSALSGGIEPRRVMISTLKWELPYKQIKVLQEAEDRVIFSAVREDGKKVILKVPRRPANAINVPEPGGPEHDIIREVEIYQRYLSKPGAAEYLPAFATLRHIKDGAPYAEIEFVEGETLYHHFMFSGSSEPGAVNQRLKQWLEIYKKAALGIQFLESEDGAQHRDIRDMNVMVTTDGKVKFIDLETIVFASAPPPRLRRTPKVEPNNILALADLMAAQSFSIYAERASALEHSIARLNEKIRFDDDRPKSPVELIRCIDDFAKEMGLE